MAEVHNVPDDVKQKFCAFLREEADPETIEFIERERGIIGSRIERWFRSLTEQKIRMIREEYGKEIPGSTLYRGFCSHCFEPMRVIWSDVETQVFCSDCDGPPPPPKTGLVARQREASRKTDG